MLLTKVMSKSLGKAENEVNKSQTDFILALTSNQAKNSVDYNLYLCNNSVLPPIWTGQNLQV